MIQLDKLGVLRARKPSRTTNPERKLAGLADLCALDRAIKLLTTLKTELDATVRARATEAFMAHGCAARQHPGNFLGEEAGCVASLELKKCGTGLTDATIALASQYQLPVTVDVTVHETYVVNPIHAGNTKLMKRVVRALNAAGLPDDLLMRQESVTRTVTTADTIDAVFKLPRAQAQTVLSAFSTMTIAKLRFNGTDEEAMKRVSALGIGMKLAA